MSNENIETLTEKIDLYELFHGLIHSVRHFLRLGIVMCFVFVFGLCFLQTWNYVPMYEASASFTVKVSNPFYATQQYYNISAAEQMAKTFPYILTSGALSEQVKSQLNIETVPQITAEALGNTNIFTLKVTSEDPVLANDVLMCVMEIYPSVSEFVVGSTAMTLINETGVPSNPVNPLGLKRPLLIGGGLAVALWLMISLLYWLTHQTISNETELGRLVNLPCLGRLPLVKGYAKRRKKGIKCPILTEHNDKYGFNESMRLLRVRVEKEMMRIKGKVLLISSSIANEGKTTISINMATALAQKGKKTLLIDCDLRNPSVASSLNQEYEVGFSEYLKTGKGTESLIHHMDQDNLFVVYSGSPVSNPEELLTNQRAHQFLTACREVFDYIILDTPPCALMADASEICAMADCALLSVRQDFATHAQILEGISVLGDSRRPILGCVLNMTASQIGKNGYSYYGYYGQYGSHRSQEKKS